MEKIIPITWYIESPIDFEHKQFLLLAYLQVVDGSFIQKHLSPHLLHMEKMIIELNDFKESYNTYKKNFERQRYIYFDDNSKLNGENNLLIDEIIEIVNFSIPQIITRIDLGNSILLKNKQILF